MPEETHEDIRQRLFDAAWDVPAYAPSPGGTVLRARRRAATTIGGAIVAVFAAIVVVASVFPIDTTERTAVPAREEDDREYLVDIRSGTTREISSMPTMKRASWLDVSPDGEQVAFTTDSTGSPQAYVANLDGSGLRQLTRGFLDVAQPVWSPAGDEIAFVALGKDSVRNLYVANVIDGRSRKITRQSRDVWTPAWSPDGTSILYNVTLPIAPTGAGDGFFRPNSTVYQLRVVEVRTRADKKLFGGTRTTAYDGTWTPEGIVFVRGRDMTAHTPGRTDLAVLGGNRKRPESLLKVHLDREEYAWSPQVARWRDVRLHASSRWKGARLPLRSGNRAEPCPPPRVLGHLGRRRHLAGPGPIRLGTKLAGQAPSPCSAGGSSGWSRSRSQIDNVAVRVVLVRRRGSITRPSS